MKAVDEIIKDLERIPKNLSTVISIKELSEKVSKELQRKTNRGISNGR